MGRRFLSHVLITLAVFGLVATYFIWVVDATLLNPARLSNTLKEAGVPADIAAVAVEKATDEAKPEDKAEMKAKIAQVITPAYVDRKINEATKSIITYVKNGSPDPVINMTDLPGQIRAAGIDLDEEEAADFDKPVLLNEDGSISKVPGVYHKLLLAKYFGVVLFIILMGFEWIVAERNQKLKRLGRVFMHASIWFLIIWLAVRIAPGKIAANVATDEPSVAIHTLINHGAVAVKDLFNTYFLGATIACVVLAASFYILRHTHKHIQKIQEVPTARIKSKAVAKLPTRR